ncbi:MAG TPA: alpha/beta hydrolase [Bryobacteraceae bacterium]|nr:alpha/beta hydrolase [Bryobacteraceae bacterium]
MHAAAFVLIGLSALVILGIIWQALAEASDRRSYPAPGGFVDGLHVCCRGEGTPVVLEAGIAASSTGWIPVQKELAAFCRVCAYDRPGLGWSEWRAGQRSVDQLLADLRKVVHHAGTPAVLVGHSFGALLVQLYAAAYPEEVRALVLVDPALLLEWAEPTEHRMRMLARGVALSRRGSWLARIGFVRLALAILRRGSAKGARVFARAASGRAASVTDRIAGQVMKLPPEVWPIVQSHWCRPHSFQSMAEHLACLPSVAAAAAAARIVPDIERVVISGGHLGEHELAEHRRLSTRHVVADNSGHWVHLDRPDVIVDLVCALVHGYRANHT